jgi:DNA-binding NtrC family response regulator
MSKKIKLLVVDDEVRFLETLSRRLGLRDFDVTPVSSGDKALEEAEKHAFDLALVDLKMPGMSGEQILEIFKKKYPDMEIVILTGHGSIDSAVQCTQAGSYSYLQKPCETEELIEVLKEAYKTRIQKKEKLNDDKMKEILKTAEGESALSVLRKLKEWEESNT